MGMMKRVDVVSEKVDSWGYKNQDGELEKVVLKDVHGDLMITVVIPDHDEHWFYPKDIPNLIKALQEAHKAYVEET